MLKEYKTRPCTVYACEIKEDGEVKAGKEKGKYIYSHKGRGAVRTILEFTSTTKPKVGDFIIRLTEDDIYLCMQDVFKAKYSIVGGVIK